MKGFAKLGLWLSRDSMKCSAVRACRRLMTEPAKGLKLSLNNIGLLLKQLDSTCRRPLSLPSKRYPDRVHGETE